MCQSDNSICKVLEADDISSFSESALLCQKTATAVDRWVCLVMHSCSPVISHEVSLYEWMKWPDIACKLKVCEFAVEGGHGTFGCHYKSITPVVRLPTE